MNLTSLLLSGICLTVFIKVPESFSYPSFDTLLKWALNSSVEIVGPVWCFCDHVPSFLKVLYMSPFSAAFSHSMMISSHHSLSSCRRRFFVFLRAATNLPLDAVRASASMPCDSPRVWLISSFLRITSVEISVSRLFSSSLYPTVHGLAICRLIVPHISSAASVSFRDMESRFSSLLKFSSVFLRYASAISLFLMRSQSFCGVFFFSILGRRFFCSRQMSIQTGLWSDNAMSCVVATLRTIWWRSHALIKKPSSSYQRLCIWLNHVPRERIVK